MKRLTKVQRDRQEEAERVANLDYQNAVAIGRMQAYAEAAQMVRDIMQPESEWTLQMRADYLAGKFAYRSDLAKETARSLKAQKEAATQAQDVLSMVASISRRAS